MIRVKRARVYDAPDSSDGELILVDRMRPRGLTRKRAAVQGARRDRGAYLRGSRHVAGCGGRCGS